MANSFFYRVTHDDHQVFAIFKQRFWRRFLIALTWSAAWGWLCYRAWHWSTGIPQFTVLMMAAIFCFLGLVIANYSITSRKLWITPIKLTFQSTSLLGRSKNDFSFNMVRGFGFGLFGHSHRPVLKFEISPKWYVLAVDVDRVEADQVIAELQDHGVWIPE